MEYAEKDSSVHPLGVPEKKLSNSIYVLYCWYLELFMLVSSMFPGYEHDYPECGLWNCVIYK